MKYVLASASPRRKELLKLVIDEFEIIPSDADETVPKDIPADRVAEYLAKIKAESVCVEDAVVIGCDTVVVADEKVLGKPVDHDDCFKMLRLLSGRKHYVYTGVCIQYSGMEGDNRILSFTEKTEVEFHKLTDSEIEEYINSGEPFDKAGGYGIQGKGSLLVKKICGDYFNVVGLPVSALNRKLKEII